MQWSDEENADFSTDKLWFYVNVNMTSGQMILQNYESVDPAVFKPYEVRAYLRKE